MLILIKKSVKCVPIVDTFVIDVNFNGGENVKCIRLIKIFTYKLIDVFFWIMINLNEKMWKCGFSSKNCEWR